MKAKTKQSTKFIEDLHTHIIGDRQFRRDTGRLGENAVQREIRPLIISYLTKYWAGKGYIDADKKAHASFYWESDEQACEKRGKVFGGRNYPDFIITKPYRVAVEYKQSPNGSTVKQGIGQSIMHTLSEFGPGSKDAQGRSNEGESHFDFVYVLFHDESKDERVFTSRNERNESKIIKTLEDAFNVFIRFVDSKK